MPVIPILSSVRASHTHACLPWAPLAGVIFCIPCQTEIRCNTGRNQESVQPRDPRPARLEARHRGGLTARREFQAPKRLFTGRLSVSGGLANPDKRHWSNDPTEPLTRISAPARVGEFLPAGGFQRDFFAIRPSLDFARESPFDDDHSPQTLARQRESKKHREADLSAFCVNPWGAETRSCGKRLPVLYGFRTF